MSLRFSRNTQISKCVMKLLLQLCQSNARLFVDRHVVKDVLLTRHAKDPIEMRKFAVQCLVQYFLHHPQELGVYHKLLNSYILVRNARQISARQ